MSSSRCRIANRPAEPARAFRSIKRVDGTVAGKKGEKGKKYRGEKKEKAKGRKKHADDLEWELSRCRGFSPVKDAGEKKREYNAIKYKAGRKGDLIKRHSVRWFSASVRDAVCFRIIISRGKKVSISSRTSDTRRRAIVNRRAGKTRMKIIDPRLVFGVLHRSPASTSATGV